MAKQDLFLNRPELEIKMSASQPRNQIAPARWTS